MSNLQKKWLGKPIQERANWYMQQIEKITKLIDPPNKLSSENLELSQHLLKQLKERLNWDYKFGNSKQGPSTSTLEGQYYNYISKGSGKLLVRVNSRPSQKWFSQLYDVEYEIGEFLRYLETTNS